MKMVKESVIRDNLSRNLSLIEPKLELMDIEKYIPNEAGTRGFIDILAKDVNGKYVLIELKRSDSSCRDAAHELLKYVEGMKINLSVKEEEIRLFVVSTHWDELLVPFSSLTNRTSLQITGFALSVTESGEPIAAEHVQPLPINQDRLFIPNHEVSLYLSEENLRIGIKSYISACKKKEY